MSKKIRRANRLRIKLGLTQKIKSGEFLKLMIHVKKGIIFVIDAQAHTEVGTELEREFDGNKYALNKDYSNAYKTNTVSPDDYE